MVDLIQRIDDSIRRRALLVPGSKILVAVSGGLDSMVLLHTLKALSSRHRWKLSVAHFNHRLRGRASRTDEQLVRRTAASMRLPVIVGDADVAAFARRSKLSVEMAARKLRHEFFARVARERKLKTIALAHHADDQVELFFIRLLRGAGVEGLSGMKWRSPSAVDRTLSLVRPLLGVRKADLAAFAHERSVRFRDDATNFSNDFLRNRIRNELLPLLAKKYQPGLAPIVLRLMDILGAESEVVREMAEVKSGKRKAESGKRKAESGNGGDFNRSPVAIQRRILQTRLAEAGVVPDFELVEALRLSPETTVAIGQNFFVARDIAGRVRLQSRELPSFNGSRVEMELGRKGKTVFDGVAIGWRFVTGELPFRKGRECFDADRVGRGVVLRHWRAGDRFRPIGMTASKKLQDLFTDAKIPRARRHRLTVATTATGEIFWVEGLRIAEDFKMTGRTKRRLVWTWRRKS